MMLQNVHNDEVLLVLIPNTSRPIWRTFALIYFILRDKRFWIANVRSAKKKRGSLCVIFHISSLPMIIGIALR